MIAENLALAAERGGVPIKYVRVSTNLPPTGTFSGYAINRGFGPAEITPPMQFGDGDMQIPVGYLPSGFEPAQGDYVVISGRRWTVADRPTKIVAMGETVAWRVRIRGG